MPLPWSKSFTIKGDLSAFQVSATPSNVLKSTTLACKLTVDGKVVATDHARGQIAAVSCLGSGYDGS